MDNQAVNILRDQKAAILAEEETFLRAMANRWAWMERKLDVVMIAAAADIQKNLRVGQIPNAAMAQQSEYYARLINQAIYEMNQFIEYSDKTISDQQKRLIELGIISAAAAIVAIYKSSGIVGKEFVVLTLSISDPVVGNLAATRALNAMVGFCGDGTPLKQYLQQIYGDAANGMTQALIDGVAKGLNPIQIAEQMRDGFGMGMNHAMNTARTETLRAYRAASLEQFRQSGVVSGWKRLAAHDGRTCAGCLFTEGKIYDVMEDFQEHNRGRCSLVPVVIGAPEPTWEYGKDWFMRQDEKMQAQILGPGRFKAWKNGASLDDMVTEVNDPVWGDSFIPTPVSQFKNDE